MSNRDDFKTQGRIVTSREYAILLTGGYVIFAGCIPDLALSYAGPPAYALLCGYFYFGFNDDARERLGLRLRQIYGRITHAFD